MKVAGVAFIFLIAAITGLMGVDFGYYFDEGVILDSIRHSLSNQTILPGSYLYPAFNHDLGLFALLPDALNFLSSRFRSETLTAYLSAISADPTYLLRMRSLTVLISACSVLWVAIAVQIWRKNYLETLIAAAVMGFSWEAAYHSRFYAVDPIMMQFGALTMMLVVISQVRPWQTRWLRLASAAAGLCAATKYTGGALLLSVILATYINHGFSGSKKKAIKNLAINGLLFFLTFALFTPGIVMEPEKIFWYMKFQHETYTKGFVGFYVESGWHHFLMIVQYFAFSIFSKAPLLSFFMFLLGLAGASALIKKEKTMAVVLLSFVVFYVLLFCRYQTMFVRNLLVLIPFCAVLVARGYSEMKIWLLGKPRAVLLLNGAVVFILVFNAAWLGYAAVSIRTRSHTPYAAKLASYIDARPNQMFVISPRANEMISSVEKKDRPNLLTADDGEAGLFIFHTSEINRQAWLCNRFNYTVRTFGPYEMNFNYYPCWMGDDRFVILKRKWAILLKGYQ